MQMLVFAQAPKLTKGKMKEGQSYKQEVKRKGNTSKWETSTQCRKTENGQTSDNGYGSQLSPLCLMPAEGKPIEAEMMHCRILEGSRMGSTRYLWRWASGMALKQEGRLKADVSLEPQPPP